MYKNELKSLINIRDIQCSKGNYDQGEYMRGMANGLIVAVSIMEGKEPKYIEQPVKSRSKSKDRRGRIQR